MPYPISSQLTKDIDFFIKDTNERKLHFASAGGILPEMIVLKYKANQRIQKEILKLEEIFEVEINPNLDNIINFPNNEMREIYLRDFVFYAKRGFYSYDKTFITDFNDPRYHLVASPISSTITPESINNELLEDLKIERSINVSPRENYLILSNF